MSPKDHKNSLKTTIMSFEKLSGEQVFKNHNNCNPFQYSPNSSIPALFCIFCVILTF